MPRMPRLQSRMPGRRRHGALQERISGRLLDAPRHAAARASSGQHRTSCRCWGSRFAPLSNWIAQARGAERAAARHRPRRKLPAWQRETFAHWAGGHAERRRRRPAVTLFNDTFTNHYDPEIGIAAVEVLERGGCRVDVVRPGCCGRPLISQGPAQRSARARGARSSTALYPIASRGEKILFLRAELSLRREGRRAVALRGEQQTKARTVADACMLFEEFAADLDLPLAAGPGEDSAARPLSSEIDGTAGRHEVAARRASPARPSSISTPAAAAWPAPSAIRASTTMFRSRSPTASCCRP